MEDRLWSDNQSTINDCGWFLLRLENQKGDNWVNVK